MSAATIQKEKHKDRQAVNLHGFYTNLSMDSNRNKFTQSATVLHPAVIGRLVAGSLPHFDVDGFGSLKVEEAVQCVQHVLEVCLGCTAPSGLEITELALRRAESRARCAGIRSLGHTDVERLLQDVLKPRSDCGQSTPCMPDCKDIWAQGHADLPCCGAFAVPGCWEDSLPANASQLLQRIDSSELSGDAVDVMTSTSQLPQFNHCQGQQVTRCGYREFKKPTLEASWKSTMEETAHEPEMPSVVVGRDIAEDSKHNSSSINNGDESKDVCIHSHDDYDCLGRIGSCNARSEVQLPSQPPANSTNSTSSASDTNSIGLKGIDTNDNSNTILQATPMIPITQQIAMTLAAVAPRAPMAPRTPATLMAPTTWVTPTAIIPMLATILTKNNTSQHGMQKSGPPRNVRLAVNVRCVFG